MLSRIFSPVFHNKSFIPVLFSVFLLCFFLGFTHEIPVVMHASLCLYCDSFRRSAQCVGQVPVEAALPPPPPSSVRPHFPLLPPLYLHCYSCSDDRQQWTIAKQTTKIKVPVADIRELQYYSYWNPTGILLFSITMLWEKLKPVYVKTTAFKLLRFLYRYFTCYQCCRSGIRCFFTPWIQALDPG
jgi:hypothetical protein